MIGASAEEDDGTNLELQINIRLQQCTYLSLLLRLSHLYLGGINAFDVSRAGVQDLLSMSEVLEHFW